MSPCKVQQCQCQTIEKQQKSSSSKVDSSTFIPFGPLGPLRPVITEPSAAMDTPGSPLSPYQTIQQMIFHKTYFMAILTK